jgi:hypothetical protein
MFGAGRSAEYALGFCFGEQLYRQVIPPEAMLL